MNFPKRSNSSPTPPQGFEIMLARFPAALGEHYHLKAAAQTLSAEYRSVYEAHARIANDKTLTDGGRLVRQAKLAKTKISAAVDKLAKARATNKAATAALDREMAKPFNFGESRFCDVALAQEIRAHFKSLSLPERMAAITSAMKNFDLQTLAAVGAAPPYLSGITDELHENARATVIRTLAPDHLENRATLAEAEDFADKLERGVLQATADLVDFSTAEEYERSAADAA